MKQIFLTVLLLFFVGAIFAQTNPHKNPLSQIPSSFKYKKELDKIAFIAGGGVKGFMAVDETSGSLSDVVTGRDPLNIDIFSPLVDKPLLIAKKETTNNEYRAFVNYVKDSIAHVLLGHFTVVNQQRKINWNEKIDWNHGRLNPMFYGEGLRNGTGRYPSAIDVSILIYRLASGENISVYPDTLIWRRENYSNPGAVDRYTKKIIHPLDYNKNYIEQQSIDESSTTVNNKVGISTLKKRKEGYVVAKDTIGHEKDIVDSKYLDYRYGGLYDAQMDWYFSHSSYANHPVVGITQKQALAYCEWKTQQWNNVLLASGNATQQLVVTLPSKAEWEFATYEKPNQMKFRKVSKSSRVDTTYYRDKTFNLFDISKNKIAYNCNFGLILDENGYVLKNYMDDGALYTAECGTYKPNANGVYDLCGNVAEWTLDNGAYTNGAATKGFEEELLLLKKKFPNSPLVGKTAEQVNDYLKQFVIVKGGSWLSNPYYLQPGVNQYFKADEAHSYIGFRVVVKVLGVDK